MRRVCSALYQNINKTLLRTCASEAAAIGAGENSENSSSMGWPKSASMIARASVVLKLLILSCNRASSSITSGGSTSGLYR